MSIFKKNIIRYFLLISFLAQFLIQGCSNQKKLNNEKLQTTAFRIGGSSTDRGNCIVVDKDGSYFVLGTFMISIFFDKKNITGGSEIFLAKYNKENALLWVTKVGDGSVTNANTLKICSNGTIIILGDFSDKIVLGSNRYLDEGLSFFLASYSTEGIFLWSKQLKNIYSESFDTDNDNNIYLVGSSINDTCSIDNAKLNILNGDTFIAMFNSKGEHKLTKKIVGESNQSQTRIKVDTENNIYLAFNLKSTLNFKGLINKHFDSQKVCLVKMNNNYKLVWSKYFGSELDFTCSYFTVDIDKTIYLTGRTHNSQNHQDGYHDKIGMFITKFDSGGNQIWMKNYENGRPTCILSDDKNNLYLSGYFYKDLKFNNSLIKSYGGSDVFISKFDGDGKSIWLEQFGGEGGDEGMSFDLSNQGDIYYTGAFGGVSSGKAYFGNSTLEAEHSDAFVLKITELK
jgi:hypothetical protein